MRKEEGLEVDEEGGRGRRRREGRRKKKRGSGRSSLRGRKWKRDQIGEERWKEKEEGRE